MQKKRKKDEGEPSNVMAKRKSRGERDERAMRAAVALKKVRILSGVRNNKPISKCFATLVMWLGLFFPRVAANLCQRMPCRCICPVPYFLCNR